MAMRTGQLWECRNSTCGCEVLVVSKSETKSRTEPRCCCGSMMKKAHVPRGRGNQAYRIEEISPKHTDVETHGWERSCEPWSMCSVADELGGG